jgi:glycerophosphoryl diester phosphodiesterase
MNVNRRKLHKFVLATFFVNLSCAQNHSVMKNTNSNPNMDKKMQKPIIIAHRGASGYRPEHTIEAYELAIEQDCDFIEPDLVITKDGHLICRHENDISHTTNVAQKPEFANRKITKIIDGETHFGWFSEDFTLAEIKTLRAIERLADLRPQNVQYNGQFEIPTFQEVLELREKKSKELKREIGIYPETKHPSYFKTIGLEFDELLLSLLGQFGLNHAQAPVFIQSFETLNLIRLSKQTKIPLIQLMQEDGGPWDSQSGFVISYKDMTRLQKLNEIAKYAYGIGPQKTMILPRDAQNNSITPTQLIKNAHQCGLRLHPWTFRVENDFLPKELRGDEPTNLGQYGNLEAEIKKFLDLGVDGIFCDFPDIARKVIKNLASN